MQLTPGERSILVQARRQGGLLGVDQCYEEGFTEGRVRSLVKHRVWSRAARGVVDTGVVRPIRPLDAGRERTAWLGLLSGGPTAVSVGLCALALHGIEGLPVELVPEVVLPGGRNNRGSNIRIRRYRRAFGTIRIEGRAVADMPYALAQALPAGDRVRGVSLIDSALHLRRLTPPGLEIVADQLRERRGGRRCLRWLDLADARAESALESRARMLAADEGLPATDLQVVIRDACGQFIARGDLGWRRKDGTWVLAEIGGRGVHSAPTATDGGRMR
ncbi:hypothetical protein [Ruania alba]|uniref:Uncharacterized protein n=1 Tax=Ruania alba TaxID=648782 RepID=A0A1H5BLU6_9MICO|nr:hypothetical protein [Ruania alba]SED55171.1 hypothetical protein SAMN04488554_0134 [Ruania alba]